jgi:hypothetical protein
MDGTLLCCALCCAVRVAVCGGSGCALLVSQSLWAGVNITIQLECTGRSNLHGQTYCTGLDLASSKIRLIQYTIYNIHHWIRLYALEAC